VSIIGKAWEEGNCAFMVLFFKIFRIKLIGLGAKRAYPLVALEKRYLFGSSLLNLGYTTHPYSF
jgi:hypothetical protein